MCEWDKRRRIVLEGCQQNRQTRVSANVDIDLCANICVFCRGACAVWLCVLFGRTHARTHTHHHHHHISYVPWVILEQKHNVAAETNFTQEICKAIPDSEKPKSCAAILSVNWLGEKIQKNMFWPPVTFVLILRLIWHVSLASSNSTFFSLLFVTSSRSLSDCLGYFVV